MASKNLALYISDKTSYLSFFGQSYFLVFWVYEDTKNGDRHGRHCFPSSRAILLRSYFSWLTSAVNGCAYLSENILCQTCLAVIRFIVEVNHSPCFQNDAWACA
jgi:hypothetical protein